MQVKPLRSLSRTLRLVGIAAILACAAFVFADQPKAPTPAATYCNPISLPDYPLGRLAREAVPGAPIRSADLWLADRL